MQHDALKNCSKLPKDIIIKFAWKENSKNINQKLIKKEILEVAVILLDKISASRVTFRKPEIDHRA